MLAASPGKVRTSSSVYFSMHDDVSVPSNPSAAAARYARSSGCARNACGVCTRTNLPVALVGSTPSGPCCTTSGMVNAGIAPPNSASDRKRGDEHVGACQRSGGVVDQHHVDRTRFDVVGEVAQHVELGGVPAVSALDQFDRRGRQFRRHGLAREVAFAAAIHQHRSRDLRHPCDGVQRPGHHAAAGQRQIRLVAVGADTCAKARGQHHTDGVGPRRLSWRIFWHCATAAGDPDLGRRHRRPRAGLLAGAARSPAGAGRAHP